MSVNIQATTVGGDKIPLAWGEGLVPTVRPGHGTFISFASGHNITVRETPAEIMALVKAAQRERDRMTIAAQFMAAFLGGAYASGRQPEPDYHHIVRAADALLAALDAREGE